MTSRVVVPYTSPSCCSRRQFSTAYPANLSGLLTPDEFSASIARVNAANRAGAGPILAYIGSWVLYGAGLSLIFNNSYDWGEDYYYQNTWTGIGIVIVGIICLVISGRMIKTRRADNLTAAVLAEHNSFNHRGLAYRIIGAGTRNASIEIDILGQQQPHVIAMPPAVHHHHEYVASPHYDHVHVASAPVVQQQPQQQYQPYFSHPMPAPAQSPHYTPVQPQFVHPAPPQYPQAYPQVDMRAPLINNY